MFFGLFQSKNRALGDGLSLCGFILIRFDMKNGAETAFILCAGTGSRLRPLTHWMPKALVPFLNLPLICYNWFLLEKMGVSRFFLNSHLFPKKLEKFIFSIKNPGTKSLCFF